MERIYSQDLGHETVWNHERWKYDVDDGDGDVWNHEIHQSLEYGCQWNGTSHLPQCNLSYSLVTLASGDDFP